MEPLALGVAIYRYCGGIMANAMGHGLCIGLCLCRAYANAKPRHPAPEHGFDIGFMAALVVLLGNAQ